MPVTVHRVTELSLEGANIVISSDCASDETSFIPTVNIAGANVNIEAGSTKGWLESAWFEALWSTYHCERDLQTTVTDGTSFPFGSATTPADLTTDAVIIDSYCGTSWMDAYNSCLQSCPGGDGDCTLLGVEYTCHNFTTCYGRIQSGAFDEMSDGSSFDDNLPGSTTVAAGGSTGAVSSTFSSGGIGDVATTVGATQPSRGSTVSMAFGAETSVSATLSSSEGIVGATSSTSTETQDIGILTTTPPSDDLNETITTAVPFFPGENNTTVLSTVAVVSSTKALTTTSYVDESTTTESAGTSFDLTTEQSTTATTFDNIVSESTTTSDASELSAPESTDPTIKSEEESPTPRPTLPPNYYNYKYPSFSPTVSPAPTALTYTPSYMPTSDARAYGFILTMLSMIAIMIMLGIDGKFAVVGLMTAAAFMPSIRRLRSTSNAKQSTGSINDDNICTYHVDIVISSCQNVQIESPLVRFVNARMENAESNYEGKCIQQHSAKIVGELEEVLEGAASYDSLC